jgi:GT2 family glycosyltransferase
MSVLAISVVICSRNRPTFLREAIHSVLQGKDVPAELVVIDQSDVSSEDLAALGCPAGCSVRYHWSQGRGVSEARNAALALAQGEIVAFTDDDVVVDRDWLGALVKPLLAAGPHSITTGRVLPLAQSTGGIGAPTLVLSETPAVYQGWIARDVLQAGNMAGYREDLLHVGGFDERLGPGTDFPAGEDNDLGLRLLAAGYLIRYEPCAVIYHRAWHEPGEYLRLRWHYGIGQGAYYAKHLRTRGQKMLVRLVRLLWRHWVLALRRTRSEPRAAAGHMAYIGGVLTGMARWAARQALVSSPR